MGGGGREWGSSEPLNPSGSDTECLPFNWGGSREGVRANPLNLL